MGYCCVPCCKSTQCKGLSFHKFPTSIESKRQWIIAISHQGNPRGCLWAPKGRSTVCSKHFKDNDYSISTTAKKILLPSAVPSIFEDLVEQKMVRRQKQATLRKESSEIRLNKTKKISPKMPSTPPVLEQTKRGRGRPRKVNNSTKQINVLSDNQKSESKDPPTNKIRKATRESAKLPANGNLSVEKKITTTSMGKEIPETSEFSTKKNNSDSVAMLTDEDQNSECATLPLTEEYSATGSECDRSDSLIDSAPRSASIKVSKNLQVVLRKLVTTIEKQRAEIARLKKEKDVLSQQVIDLKRQHVNHMYIKM